ncbi:hypothetical protein K1X13_05290 [Nocardioides sp. WL0053]|uniref:LemA protein n=1 Tax=Nocardioides jiangsuensis TaxID=2866161 RepID=A0ABS7RI92_9ACTN|nr:hypothetical protein [Nocardioides jiangsuensis]MBY9074232.1 hypothetical protein [Nocardioides jiangsuensis]
MKITTMGQLAPLRPDCASSRGGKTHPPTGRRRPSTSLMAFLLQFRWPTEPLLSEANETVGFSTTTKGALVATILSVIALGGTVAGAVMWVVNTFRHRSHLSQCVQDLQRHHRLDRRLIGCVNEMERILDGAPPQSSGAEIPEELVGHARYLFGLRQEAADNATRLSRHAVRLRWPDGYLGKATLAGKRCEVAHGALIRAFQALGDATREYERGITSALLQCGDGPGARAPSNPVRLLNEPAAEEVARLREVCEEALTHTADACNLRFYSHAVFDTKWPVRRSEIMELGTDPYKGEVKPMRWTGFGPQPLLHVDAR